MKKYLILTIIPLLAACEMTIPVELPDQEPKLVMNAIVNPEEPFEAFITKSHIMADDNNDYLPITNAVVSVYQQDVYLGELNYNANTQRYSSATLSPQPGKDYTLKASATGFDDISASQVIPMPLPVNEATFQKNVRQNAEGYQMGDLKVKINDQKGVKNYYALQVYFDNSMQQPVEGECFETTDPVLQDEAFNFTEEGAVSICGRVYFTDELFDGKNYELTVSFADYIYNNYNKLVVKLFTVSEEYYLYKRSAELQQSTQGNPFAEPVIIYNNIKNGYGIFGAYSSDTLQINY